MTFKVFKEDLQDLMCLCCLFCTSVIFQPLFKIWSAVFCYNVFPVWVLYIRNGKRLHFTKLESYLVKTWRNSAVKHFQKMPIFNAKPIWIETRSFLVLLSRILMGWGIKTERKKQFKTLAEDQRCAESSLFGDQQHRVEVLSCSWESTDRQKWVRLEN